MKHSRFPLIALALVSLLRAAAEPAPMTDEEVPKGDAIARLIRGLGAEDFGLREAAARELAQREDAFIPLHLACQSTDAEVQRLAADSLGKLRDTLKRKALDSLKVLAKNGEADLFFDRFVALRSDLRDEDWQTGLDLARNLAERARRITKKDIKFPDQAFMTWAIINSDDDVPSWFGQRRVAVTRIPPGKAPGDGIFRSFATCQEKVVMRDSIYQSILFTLGPILVVDDYKQADIRESVIFCDGDVETDNIYKSLVIASGSVRVNRKVIDSMIIQNDQNSLGFVKPFALEKSGIAVKSVDGSLEVTQLADGKPFARSGLRRGDVLLSVDEVKPKTAEEFRKLVRKNILPFKVTNLQISRQGERLRLLVHLDL